ncbi:MAG TPA: GDSL-type esterase/lipase family protein [Acidobacteriota bacterium]|nr:GDSL-type esterase/lipase family protein [Acidobacteriota bacterium]
MNYPTSRIIATLVLAALPAVLAAQAEGFDLAVDSEGKAWMGRFRTGFIEISDWDGEHWRVVHTVEAVSSRGLQVTPFGDGIALAWIEGAGSDAGIALATANERSITVLSPEGLPGGMADSLAVAGMEGGNLALLISLGSGYGAEVRFLVLDADAEKVLSASVLSASGAVSSLSLLGGADPWMAWQERRELEIRIAVAQASGARKGEVRRFGVRGFGGIAAPVLIRSKRGAPVLAWQGTQDRWTAVVRTRELSDGKLGPVSTAPLPEGISGALYPRAAAGAAGLATAYGWGGGRNGNWFGLRYELGETGGFTVDLRGVSDGHVYMPKMAAAGPYGEIWAWQDDTAAAAQIATRRGSELSFRTPRQLEPLEVEPDKVYALAFGDSITAGLVVYSETEYEETGGYLPYLKAVYTDKIAPLEILQDGESATQTLAGLTRLPVTLEENPHLNYVLILYGTNDVNNGDLTPEITSENLGKMADMVRDAGAIPIVATLLPRFDSDYWKVQQAAAISEAIYPMARLRGITICDFQKLFPADLELFSDARLHPNQAGYAKMAEFWFPALAAFKGDVNRSLAVDDNDLLLLTAVLRARRGSWGFNPDADFNDDGYIDVADLAFLLSQVGKSFK